MINKAEEALHREQDLLWTIKAIYTEFRGDLSFAPMGMFQDTQGDQILGRDPHIPSISAAETTHPASVFSTTTVPVVNGESSDSTVHPEVAIEQANGGTVDVEMVDQSTIVTTNGVDAPPVTEVLESIDRADHAGTFGNEAAESAVILNGNGTAEVPIATLPVEGGDAEEPHGASAADIVAEGSAESVIADDGESSAAPSHRMTTRARANPTHTPSPMRSISPVSYVPPTDPFFTFPSGAIPDHSMGLPQQRADETGLALSSYISKQEEIVRSLKELHAGLLSGLKMRQNVWKWTRAEGHVGEMSDNEDWVDLEEWGIDLRDPKVKYTKGEQDADQVDEEEERRGKRVRRVGRTAKD